MTTLHIVDTPRIDASNRTTVTPRRRPSMSVVPLHDELWRVTRQDGDVLGYVEQFRERQGLRYRAKRMIALQRRFIVVGEFWSIDEALDSFGW